MEVQDAVAAKLAEVTPDKLEQFELLIQDHRSIRRLADETLNDERVVTADNAPRLLEAMRAATIEEEKAALDAEMKKARERMNKRHESDVDALEKTQAELSATSAALSAAEARERDVIDRLITRTNNKLKIVEYVITGILLLMGACAILDYTTGYLKTYMTWRIILGVGGLIGLYHLFAHILQWPLYGLSNVLNDVGRRLFKRSLRAAELRDRFNVDNEAEFKGGRMLRKQAAVQPTPGNLV
jgi:hypothetical protein